MKSRSKWYLISFLVLGLFVASCAMSCSGSQQTQTTKEQEEILSYLDTMAPVMGKHADWYDDQNALAEARGLDYNEAEAKLHGLISRMEQIYMDVETSIPPPVLREYKHKWSRVCQLNLQTLTLMLQLLEERNLELVPKINELTFQANDLKTEADEELIDILSKYDISFDPFSR